MQLDVIFFIATILIAAWLALRGYRAARATHDRRVHWQALELESHHGLPALDSTPDYPFAFGYKTAWLAVRAPRAEAVIEAARMNEPRVANWQSGFGAEIFVTPPIDGWVLVLSDHLPPLDPTDRALWDALLSGLAAQFQHVCYFATHRVVEYHAWARFEDGRLIRAYCYCGESGEILVNEGSVTPEEVALGHTFAELPPGPVHDERPARLPNEEDVLDVAAAWSVSTKDLARLAPGRSTGWVARWPASIS